MSALQVISAHLDLSKVAASLERLRAEGFAAGNVQGIQSTTAAETSGPAWRATTWYVFNSNHNQ
jgi:hypothetical protein